MVKEKNYLANEINTTLEVIKSRFLQLGSFLKNHSDNLSDTEILYKFNCDVYYELDWIQDKLQLANKTEVAFYLAQWVRVN